MKYLKSNWSFIHGYIQNVSWSQHPIPRVGKNITESHAMLSSKEKKLIFQQDNEGFWLNMKLPKYKWQYMLYKTKQRKYLSCSQWSLCIAGHLPLHTSIKCVKDWPCNMCPCVTNSVVTGTDFSVGFRLLGNNRNPNRPNS